MEYITYFLILFIAVWVCLIGKTVDELYKLVKEILKHK